MKIKDVTVTDEFGEIVQVCFIVEYLEKAKSAMHDVFWI